MRKQLLFIVACFIATIRVNSQGKVGINTASPQAMLHVKDSNVLFSGATTLPVVPGNPPFTGTGTRMMWYPDKAAFRAGYVAGANWDKDSIGRYSFSTGNDTRSTADNAISSGFSTRASGFASVAMGSLSVASGNVSVALGYDNRAIGFYSVALGDQTSAIGTGSVSLGASSEATGNFSIAAGVLTTARTYACLAIGRYNDSLETSSPTTWVSSDPVFIVGNGSSPFTSNNAFVIYKNGNTYLEGELTRPSTGADKNLVPVCYGSVSNTGLINSGTSNFSVAHTAAGQFEISIVGETYSNSGYVSTITVVNSSAPRMVTTTVSAGKLVVKIWDIAATLVDNGFHFVVYKQ